MSVNVNEYSEQSTKNLVLMTLAGKQSAYEALVIRYERMVIAYANQIVRSEYMAQDAAQDAFVTAWLKLDTLAAPEKFGSWVARIAKNSAIRMAEKFRDYIDIDSFTGYESCFAVPFEDSLSSGEDYSELHDSINSLSDKVKKVICLYYFEGLSIAQIAARMSTSVGTVKRQLHDGRQKIRKDLCSMNETIDDTLVERVMKKVAEFNLYWQFNNDKTDFAASYKPLLEEVKALPESTKKNYALAAVLQLGWWYSGEKSDEALARLKEASLNGKNDDAMELVMCIEHDKLSGKDKIDFMRNVQLPYLEENGFLKSQAYVWFWMGREYLNPDIMDFENAAAAFNRTLELLEPKDIYYANALSALKLTKMYSESSRNTDKFSSALAHDLRMYNGEQKLYSEPGFTICSSGFFYGVLYYATNTISILSRSAAVGETIREQGRSAVLLSVAETVDTPAGRFENCELWEMDNRISIYVKPDVGIVKCVSYEIYDSCGILLGEYSIKSGSGKMPFGVGNSWIYVSASPESIDFREEYEVIFADEDGRTVLSSFTVYERAKYDESSWKDMVLKLKADYYAMANNADWNDWDADGSMRMKIFDTLQRMKELAATPYEKHFTDRADSAMRRIITSNPNYVPDCKEVGLWNFFDVYRVSARDGVKSLVKMDYHFEWKWWYDAAYMLEHNFMLGELGNCGAVWDDDWKPGYSGERVTCPYGRIMTTSIKCEDGGTVTTEAGTFENCIKVTIDISGSGYLRGKKEYFFAKGIGIVRCIHHTDPAVYELTSYEGVGEGYMPLEDGIVRRYKGVDFPNGMRGEIDFACAADGHGQLTVIVDQIGQQSREEWDKSDQPEQLLAKK